MTDKTAEKIKILKWVPVNSPEQVPEFDDQMDYPKDYILRGLQDRHSEVFQVIASKMWDIAKGFNYAEYLTEEWVEIVGESYASHLQQRVASLEEEVKRLNSSDDYTRGHVDGFVDGTTKLKQLEELLKAADEVMNKLKVCSISSTTSQTEYLELCNLINKYTSLRSEVNQ